MSGMCRPCFMFVSTLASYVACLLRLGVACRAVMQRSGRVGCCDAAQWACGVPCRLFHLLRVQLGVFPYGQCVFRRADAVRQPCTQLSFRVRCLALSAVY